MNQQQILAVLELQDRMNSRINPEWKTAGSAWMRAVMVEGVEGLESQGWKWWKKQTPDLANIRMELVDIWHFIVSEAIIQTDNNVAAAEVLLKPYLNALFWSFGPQAQYAHLSERSPQEVWDLLIGFAALRAPLSYVLVAFRTLQHNAGMSGDDLYRGYLSKNVLNFFRQDHGYKEGTYYKEWFGEEDNVWLERIAADLGSNLNETTLYEALTQKYIEVEDVHTKAGTALTEDEVVTAVAEANAHASYSLKA